MGGEEISPDQEFVGPYRPLQFGILAFSHSQITGLWRFFFVLFLFLSKEIGSTYLF